MATRTETPLPYLRVSSDEQRERATIETQRVEIQKYAAAHDITLSAWYADDGWSGRKLSMSKRPDGARPLADATAGGFQTVIVYRVDRLGRGRKLLASLDELESAGVRYIISITDARQYDIREPNDEFYLTMLSGVSGHEANMFLRHSKDATNRLALEGAWLGGIVPYGYHVEGEGRTARLFVSETLLPRCSLSEAGVIRLIYRRTVEDNWPCLRIADELNALAVPPAYVRDGREVLRGKRVVRTQGIWRPGRIRNMLVNTTYMGVHRYGKRSTDEERELIERAVPAIVDATTWERAQAALRAHLRFSARNAKRQYLLRGLITCGCCGLTYSGTGYKEYGTERVKTYYKCNGAAQLRGIFGSQGKKCPSKAINGERLEAEVWADLDEFMRNPDDVLVELAEQLHGEETRADQMRDALAGLKMQFGAKQAERDTMLALYRRGRIDAAALDRQLDQIAEEEGDLRVLVTEQESALSQADRIESDLRSAEALLREARERLDDSPDFATRQDIVRLFVERVTVVTNERGHKEANARVSYRFKRQSRGAPPSITTRTGRGSWPLPA